MTEILEDRFRVALGAASLEQAAEERRQQEAVEREWQSNRQIREQYLRAFHKTDENIVLRVVEQAKKVLEETRSEFLLFRGESPAFADRRIIAALIFYNTVESIF